MNKETDEYYLYVDSAFRNNGTPTDFTIITNTKNKGNKNSGLVGLKSINISTSFYQINSTNNELHILEGVTDRVIYISDATYKVNELLVVLNAITFTGNSLSWGYDEKNNKLTVVKGNSSSNIILKSSSTIKDVLGFSVDYSTSTSNSYLPFQLNLRPYSYVYLVSNNLNSSNNSANIQGNNILFKISLLTNRNSHVYQELTEINYLSCDVIPYQWNFRLIYPNGRAISNTDYNIDFNFTLKVIAF